MSNIKFYLKKQPVAHSNMIVTKLFINLYSKNTLIIMQQFTYINMKVIIREEYQFALVSKNISNGQVQGTNIRNKSFIKKIQ